MIEKCIADWPMLPTLSDFVHFIIIVGKENPTCCQDLKIRIVTSTQTAGCKGGGSKGVPASVGRPLELGIKGLKT